MILLLDNYDSFTYNLYQYLSELGADVLVKRNDELTVGEVAALEPEKIVISPGPCTPNEAGISVPLVRELGDPSWWRGGVRGAAEPFSGHALPLADRPPRRLARLLGGNRLD